MSTFAERARAGIEALSPGDLDEWIEFQRRNHGAEARQGDPAWLRWLDANPDNDANSPRAWICRRDGDIVGTQGAVPFRLQEGDRIHRAAWAVDLMVEPDWRLRGVGPALTEAQVRANDPVAALSISQAAYRAYLRGGWRDLGDVPMYVRPKDVGWSVTQAGLHGAKAGLTRAFVRPTLAMIRLGSYLATRMMGTELHRIESFDDRVDRVWAMAKRRYAVLAVRDHLALSWRFDAVPDADRLTRYYLTQGGRVRGYVVTRHESWRGATVLAIVDYLASPRWILPMLAHVTALDEARDVGAITCRTLSPGSGAAFKATGFIRVTYGDRTGRLDRSAGTPLRFMVYQGDQPERIAFDPDAWFLTGGDSDIEFGGGQA